MDRTDENKDNAVQDAPARRDPACSVLARRDPARYGPIRSGLARCGPARYGTARPMRSARLRRVAACALLALILPPALVSPAQAVTPYGTKITPSETRVVCEAKGSPKRIALVLGIQTYEHLTPLFNPLNDAKAMADVFCQHGIGVTLGLDLTHDEIAALLSRFAKAAKSADLAIFYYAGHGLKLADANVLLPRDMPKRCGDVSLEEALIGTVTLDEVLTAVEGARENLVIWDACRTAKFPACPPGSRGEDQADYFNVRGLTRDVPRGKGGLFVASTVAGAPALDGDPGGNSPFARALLKGFRTPTAYFYVTLDDVVRDMTARPGGQRPEWKPLGLLPKGCLAGVGCGTDEPPQPPVVPGTPPADTGQAGLLAFIKGEWDRIKESENPEVVKGFRAQFGKDNPYYDGLAADRLGVLERKAKERELALLQQQKEQAERKAADAKRKADEERKARAEDDEGKRREETRQKVEQAGGYVGKVNITLKWRGHDDLDV